MLFVFLSPSIAPYNSETFRSPPSMLSKSRCFQIFARTNCFSRFGCVPCCSFQFCITCGIFVKCVGALYNVWELWCNFVSKTNAISSSPSFGGMQLADSGFHSNIFEPFFWSDAAGEFFSDGVIRSNFGSSLFHSTSSLAVRSHTLQWCSVLVRKPLKGTSS